MLDGEHTTLRQGLRAETNEDHARIDALFSTLDLTQPTPLGHFLAAHHAGFTSMRREATRDSSHVGVRLLCEMIDALQQDLFVLQRKTLTIQGSKVCGEAVDHIVLGSRLGTAVLRRQWAASNDENVRRASHYFSLAGHSKAWRAHTEKLSTMSATGERAETLISDTKQLYRLFERSFHGAA